MDISEKHPEDYLRQGYARILVPEADGTFSAEILEFPGCFSQGETAEEAYRNLEEAAKSWIEAALDQGQEIPLPSSNQGYSGKIALRLPRSLHRAAIRKAERDGISLNQCLVTAVATWVGADDMYSRLIENIRRSPMLAVAVSANINMRNYFDSKGFISPATIEQKAATTQTFEEMPNPLRHNTMGNRAAMEVLNG